MSSSQTHSSRVRFIASISQTLSILIFCLFCSTGWATQDKPNKRTSHEGQKGERYHQKAIIHLKNNEYELAVKYYSEALFEARKTNNHSLLFTIFNSLGGISYNSDNYRQGIFYYKKAKQYAYTPKQKATTYNNIGSSFVEMKMLDSAELYLNEAKSYLSPPYPRFIYTTLSELYLKKRNKSRATHFFHLIPTNEITAEREIIEFTLLKSAHLALQGAHKEAYELLETTDSLNNHFITRRRLLFQKIGVLTEIGAFEEAAALITLNNSQKREHLQEYNYAGMPSLIENNVEQLLENEKNATQLQLAKEQEARTQLIAVIELIGIFCLVLIAIILFSRKRLLQKKARLEKELLKVRERTLEKEIKDKNQFMAEQALSLHSTYKTLLKAAKFVKEDGSGDKVEQIIHDGIQQTERWQNFKTYFEENNVQFFKTLLARYPKLTNQDLRLAAYLRMGLSTKEIAFFTNRSISGVENARIRLRQRLELERTVRLNTFLINFEQS